MKNWIKYGLFNAIIGLLIGIYILLTANGDGYALFAFIAPIAAFLVAVPLWKYWVKENYTNTKIIITGLITGTFSHYISFLLLSIILNICYWSTGGCTGSLNDPPADIITMLGAGFAYAFFSIIALGWITVPGSIIIGYIVKSLEKK